MGRRDQWSNEGVQPFFFFAVFLPAFFLAFFFAFFAMMKLHQ